MLLVITLVVCSIAIIRTDDATAAMGDAQTTEAIDEEQEIKLTYRPHKDFFGRAVIVKAVPPSNYAAYLYGPYSSNEWKFHKVWFNASGFWGGPSYRGDLTPFTWYNLTINDTESKQSSITFMTDVGEPAGGVNLNFTRTGADFVEVSLEPQVLTLVNGPPTGYHVEACVAPEQTPCNFYVCHESGCKLDKLQPATNYSVKAFIFNVDSFNRTLENRLWIKLYNVTTEEDPNKEDPSSSSVSPWVFVGGSLLGMCGLTGIGFAGFKITKKVSKKPSRTLSPPTDEATEL